MSESLVNLSETTYSDEELFALQALESVVVDPSIVGAGNSETFNSAV